MSDIRVHLKGGDKTYRNCYYNTLKTRSGIPIGISIHREVGRGNAKGNRAIAKHYFKKDLIKKGGRYFEVFNKRGGGNYSRNYR
jgi:hypothetical protein